MTNPDDPAFSPSSWWVWLLIGLGGLTLTVLVGFIFGLSAIDVLLGRDDVMILFIAFDYTFIGLGIWLAIRSVLRREESDAL